MACIITAPTLLACNDKQGGAKKLEVVAWTSDFDDGTATYIEIPLDANSAYGKETPTVNADNHTSYITEEVMFKVAGLGNFASYNEFVKAILIFRITLFDDTTAIYGAFKGLSFSGGERTTGQNMEDFQGSTMTYSGVSPTGATIA